jgi:hypothetical protein
MVFYRLVGVLAGAARPVLGRVRGRDGESGQGALEYVGMLMLVAGVVALLLATDIGGQLVGFVGDAISKAFGGGG